MRRAHRLMHLSRDSLACIAATILAGLVYLNALSNPFVLDDNRTVVDNASITDITNLRAVVGHDVTRPLVNLSYAIDRRLWGPAPFGFHMSSVLLHMLNVCLLFQLVRRLATDHNARAASHDRPIHPGASALAAAVVFAVHPVMTQAVGYISGRSEVLCASFFLAAMLTGRRWLQRGGGVWWTLTIVFWLASILAKEIGVVLPIVLWATDRLFWSNGHDARRHFIRFYLPLMGIALVGALGRVAVFVMFERPAPMSTHWPALLDGLILVWRYVGLLLVPTGQSIFHEIHPAAGLLDWRVISSVTAIAGASAVAWRARRRWPFVTVGLLWFFALLAPSFALMVLDAGADMAEHRVYLASCGGFIAVGALMGALVASADSGGLRWRWWVATTLLIAMVLSLSGRTLLRNAMWSSGVTIWSEAVQRAPGHWLPQTVLGEALHDAGRHEDAIAAHRAALDLNPDEDTIYLKLGFCLAELGRTREARAIFERLRARHPQSPTVSLGLGIVAMMSGQPDEGRARFQEALSRDADNLVALQWWARLEEQAGHPAEALRLCQEVQRLDPWLPGNRDCLARNRDATAR